MPAPRGLQQRSSIGSAIRGISSSSSNTNSNNNNNNPSADSNPRSRPIEHRSVKGQPNYQTVHGGVLSRRETVQSHPRSMYQSSSLLQSGNNGRQSDQSSRGNPRERESYASSSRLTSSNHQQGSQSSSQNQQQRSQNQGASNQQQSNRNSQFAQRSGQHSWNNSPQNSGNKNSNPTVVSSRRLSVNLNNAGSKNRGNGQHGSSGGNGNSQPNSYASSRRLLEVGRNVEPTHRPVTQTAGALQDSWPNSNTHHHLTPILKNQKVNKPGGDNYYESTQEQGSPWGSHVR